MKKLGYQTIYWYGGNASNGNFNHFGRAQGFDRVESATDFCGPQAPRTWVGVYDHVFLQEAAKRIKEIQEPTFHFIYTTSNHGPYKIEPEVLKFDKSIFDESIGSDIRDNEERCKALGTAHYADQAVNRFIDEIQEAFPDSLILYTGDHSNLYGDLSNSSLVPRDYMFRELYCTPLLIHHPQLSTDWFAKAKMGTHLNIIPTVLELIAPKRLYVLLTVSGLDANSARVLGDTETVDDRKRSRGSHVWYGRKAGRSDKGNLRKI